jgi:hypothetical protein
VNAWTTYISSTYRGYRGEFTFALLSRCWVEEYYSGIDMVQAVVSGEIVLISRRFLYKLTYIHGIDGLRYVQISEADMGDMKHGHR